MISIVNSIKKIKNFDRVLLFCFPSEKLLPKCNLIENAGIDFRLNSEEPYYIYNTSAVKVPLGFKIAFPSGFELQLRPRSGFAYKNGSKLIMPNSPATIDPSYRNEVCALFCCAEDLRKEEAIIFKPYSRICQGVIKTYFIPNYIHNLLPHNLIFIVNEEEYNKWHELIPSDRGLGGFGHTKLD